MVWVCNMCGGLQNVANTHFSEQTTKIRRRTPPLTSRIQTRRTPLYLPQINNPPMIRLLRCQRNRQAPQLRKAQRAVKASKWDPPLTFLPQYSSPGQLEQTWKPAPLERIFTAMRERVFNRKPIRLLHIVPHRSKLQIRLLDSLPSLSCRAFLD